jgi:hypothetical protein
VAALAAGITGALLFVMLFVAIVLNNNDLGITTTALGLFVGGPVGLVIDIIAVVHIQRRRLRGLWMAVSSLAVNGTWVAFMVVVYLTT